MKTTKSFTLILIFSLFIANSCKKADQGPAGAAGTNGVTGPTGTNGVTGPTGPSLNGNIKGFVTLYDQYGIKYYTNLKGVSVSLDGTGKTTTTDSTGMYSFSGLATGTYNLTYTDSGYGSNRVQDLQLAGAGDVFRDVRMSQIPNFNAATITATDTVTGVILSGTIAGDMKPRTLIIYVGSTSGTSSNPATFFNFYTKNILQNATTFSTQIPLGDLNNMGFTTGSVVYFAVYGVATNFNNSSSYEDLSTGRVSITAVSANPATTSIVL